MYVTQARLKELLNYDQETGVFTWRIAVSNCVNVGDIAGTINNQDYRHINISRRRYMAHHLAWLYVYGVWPDAKLDHWNGISSDNSIRNLRKATQTENCRNTKRYKSNTSGFRGVSQLGQTQKWQALIGINGKLKYLGSFDTPQAASIAYEAASDKVFGEFKRK